MIPTTIAKKWAVVAGCVAIGAGVAATYQMREPEPPLEEVCRHITKVSLNVLPTDAQAKLGINLEAIMTQAGLNQEALVEPCVRKFRVSWEMAKDNGTAELMREHIRCVLSKTAPMELMMCG